MTEDLSALEAVFGNDSSGATPELRAVTSRKLFVRSQHQLSEYREGATGRIINAREALRLVGWESLGVLAYQSAVPILVKSDEPYRSISKQLKILGLSLEEVARKVGWSNEVRRKFEGKRQVPFRALERLARAVGLESDKLGIAIDAGADVETGVRLRTYKSADPNVFTATTVLGLAEAAWTIQKQYTLGEIVGSQDHKRVQERGFKTSDAYGSHLVKTYQEGYRLAQEARKLLGLSTDRPILSMKELIEDDLKIPVVQLEIHSHLAGATLSSGSYRGIVLNLKGDNENALVRRMTMAHELGHILWDPDQRLKRLVVDRYDSIIRDAVTSTESQFDAVERRANAFAVEFLAPKEAILKQYREAGEGAAGLAHLVQSFGVSKTALTNHLMNASHNQIDLTGARIPVVDLDDWEARESLAIPLFAPQSVPISRRGRFSRYVLQALDKKLISRDTASSLYQCDEADLDKAVQSTRNYISP